MAKDSDDNYKEGVDFEYVQGNGDDNSNFKTRHFFTRAEKAARAAGTTMPKAAPVKAKPKAKAKPKLQGLGTPEKITVKKLDPAVRPEGKASGMPESLGHEVKRRTSSAIPILAVGAAGAGASGGTRRADSSRAYNPNYGKGKGMPEGPQGKMKSTEVGPRGGRGRAGVMLGNDPMFHALGGGGFGAIEDLNDRALLQYKKGGAVKMAEGGSTGTRRKPMSDEQKYRPANARNMDMAQLGKAKIRAAKNIEDSLKAGKKSNSYGNTFSEDSTAYGLRDKGSRMLGESYGRSIGDDTTGKYKKGGVVKMKEGSAKDTREDKAMAKKSGMTMKKWEKSSADVKHDAPGKMRKGGVVKKATGSSMRGTGAAVRGKGFSGCY